MKGPGIIYTRTTAAEETAAWLRERGVAADFYHGQRQQAERDAAQDAFMNDEVRVICATNAFGLGIDKPNIRFVIHRDIPASLESYYQEVGRAGRDDEFARCVLLYRPGDLSRAAFLAAGSHVTVENLTEFRALLRKHPSARIDALEEATDVGKTKVAEIVSALQRAGLVRTRGGRVRLLKPDFDPESVSLEADERRQAYERSRVEMVRRYAEISDCRRVFILNYFAEEPSFDECGRCDNDLLKPEADWVPVNGAPETVALPFAVGDAVRHQEWGQGMVQRIEDDSLTVLFDDAGFKVLASDLVVERNLLVPAKGT
jgi:ATP-dependent DNA helicase RecQ